MFLRRRSVLKTVDVLERARHDDVVVGAEDIVAGGEGDGVAVFDGEDVEPVLLADIGVHEVFARPLFGDFDLEHAVVGAELYKVEDVVRVVSHRGLEGEVLFGVDDLVGAVAEQEFALDLAARHRNDVFRAHVLEERCHFQRGLEALAHGDEADVEVVDADLRQHFLAAAIADDCVREVVGEAVDGVLVLVGDHDLIAELREFEGEVGAEASHAYDKNGFHIISFAAYGLRRISLSIFFPSGV